MKALLRFEVEIELDEDEAMETSVEEFDAMEAFLNGTLKVDKDSVHVELIVEGEDVLDDDDRQEFVDMIIQKTTSSD